MGRYYATDGSDTPKWKGKYYVGMILCLIVVAINGIHKVGWSSHIHESQLKDEVCVLSGKPQLVQVSKGKSAHFVIVFSCENLYRQFLIDDVELECIDQEEFIREMKKGDRVLLGTLVNDPDELKTRDGNSTYTRVVTFVHGNKVYIGLKQRNTRAEHTAAAWMWTGLIGAILFFIPLLFKREILLFNDHRSLAVIIFFVTITSAMLLLKYTG